MDEKSIISGYEYAKERYAELGIDVDKAMERANAVPVSMQCWQADDVIGFDGTGTLDGGLAATGGYPGRARTAQELRSDAEQAFKLIPGKKKFNLHACYAEKNGKKVDRDGYTVEQFAGWLDWAKGLGLGLDFNPTFFSHPRMDDSFSLSSFDAEKRRFWIEHGKRCREIGLEFARETGEPCVIDYWMPDGYKDICADTLAHRELMTAALDEIFAADIDEQLVPCAVESKLFGMGVESYTVASHEYSLAYALTRDKLYCIDSGHFHPTETVSAKITAIMSFLERALLHVSRGVRWDSDHAVIYDGELQSIMDEIVLHDYLNRIFIALDYFDASINRLACWTIGMRSTRKALLSSFLAPFNAIVKAEREGDHTRRLALMEERKTLPLGAVWDYYCLSQGVAGDKWIEEVKRYEKKILADRG